MSCLCNDPHTTRPPDLLAGEHGKLRRYMGEIAFTALARAYAARYPSGPRDRLPEFLAAAPRYALHRELAELAFLERALSQACEAAAAPATALAELATLKSEELETAVFALHPSTRRFKVSTNVTSLWSCLRCDEIPPKPSRLAAPQEILVWRQNQQARFRLLGDEEAKAFDAAASAAPFAAIHGTIAALDDPATATRRAFAYLRGWIEAQAVSGIRLAAAVAAK